MLNSSAFLIEFSTNSAPRTSLRIFKPLSNSSVLISAPARHGGLVHSSNLSSLTRGQSFFGSPVHDTEARRGVPSELYHPERHLVEPRNNANAMTSSH